MEEFGEKRREGEEKESAEVPASSQNETLRGKQSFGAMKDGIEAAK